MQGSIESNRNIEGGKRLEWGIFVMIRMMNCNLQSKNSCNDSQPLLREEAKEEEWLRLNIFVTPSSWIFSIFLHQLEQSTPILRLLLRSFSLRLSVSVYSIFWTYLAIRDVSASTICKENAIEIEGEKKVEGGKNLRMMMINWVFPYSFTNSATYSISSRSSLLLFSLSPFIFLAFSVWPFRFYLY